MPVCKEELSRGNIERVERSCSRRFIAGRSSPSRLGRGETGRTTEQTSMPPSNNARREGNEKLAGMPRKSTRGGRFIKKSGVETRQRSRGGRKRRLLSQGSNDIHRSAR